MSAIRAALRTSNLLRRAAVVLIACGVVLACNPKTQQQAGTPAATALSSASPTGTTEPVTPPPAAPALAVTQASWSPDALEQLVAPIALYPDQLVGQILAASVNSQEVLDGGNWLLQNENIKGNALDAAAQKAGLGPAMRALVQFPTVVDMLCQQMDWTRQLGSAFTSDQTGVLDAVQRLRSQAAKVGNLQSTPQQKVETKTEGERTIIEVKPADPQVIYVPQYNPQFIYTTSAPPPPAPAAPTSTTSTEGTVNTGTAVAGGLLAFGVGVLVGNAMRSNDNCYPHWGAGAVFVGPRPFYPPAYVYRPAYGPGFRPAYHYAPPPNYRYAYNNANIKKNVNVNNNYFNQFDQNRNLSGVTRNTGPSWKGQSSYAGARSFAQTQHTVAQTQRDVAQSQRNVARTERSNQTAGRVGGARSTRNPALGSSRANSPDLARTRGPSADLGSSRTPAIDRGYGESNRGTGQQGLGAARDWSNLSRPTPPASDSSLSQRDHAFSGAGTPGSGAFDRAASARGHASAGGLVASKGRGRPTH
jgi:hypothetical protein